MLEAVLGSRLESRLQAGLPAPQWYFVLCRQFADCWHFAFCKQSVHCRQCVFVGQAILPAAGFLAGLQFWISSSWKNQVDLAPVLLRGGALGGPVWRVVELIGNLCRPETAGVAIEKIALHRLAQSGCSAVAIRFPSGRKHKRAAQGDVRSRGRLLRRSLQSHYVVFGIDVPADSLRLAIN